MKRTTFKRLAGIHAIDLPQLRTELVNAFVAETGIDRSDPVAIQIASIPDSEALALVNWKTISATLQERVSLSSEKLDAFIQHVTLLAERAVLYPRLYYALSGTKLLERNAYPLSPTLPTELQAARREFMQTIHLLDEHLRYGIMMLTQFQLLLQRGASIATLRTELQEAEASYTRYLLTRSLVDERYGFICWYLQQVQHPVAQSTPHAA